MSALSDVQLGTLGVRSGPEYSDGSANTEEVAVSSSQVSLFMAPSVESSMTFCRESSAGPSNSLESDRRLTYYVS